MRRGRVGGGRAVSIPSAPAPQSYLGAAMSVALAAMGMSIADGTFAQPSTYTGAALSFSLETLTVSSTGGTWSAPGTFTHYASPTGTDTYANATDISTPCSILTAHQNAQPGDIVAVRGGTYTIDFTGANYETPALRPTNTGTLGTPIIFMAYTGETPVWNANPADPSMAVFGVRDSNYIIYDGITGTLAEEVNTAWLCVFLGTTIGATTNCIVRNCTFYGSGVNTTGNNSAPIRMDLCVGCEAYNNTISGNEGAATGINSCGIWLFTVQDCIIRNNEIFNCENGIMQKNPNNETCQFYHNFIHDIGTNGFNFNEQNGVDPVGGHIIRDNLLLNIGVNGIFFGDSYATGQPNYSIYNNTMHNVGIGVGTHGANGWKALTNHSNIISQHSGAYQQMYSSWTYTALSNNQYFDSTGDVWYDGYNTPITTLAAWQTFTGMDANSAVGDPLFVNAAGTTPADFALQGGSPCIGTGLGGVNKGVLDLSQVGVQ